MIELAQLLERSSKVEIHLEYRCVVVVVRRAADVSVFTEESERLHDQVVPIVRLPLHRSPEGRTRNRQVQHRVEWATLYCVEQVD